MTTSEAFLLFFLFFTAVIATIFLGGLALDSQLTIFSGLLLTLAAAILSLLPAGLGAGLVSFLNKRNKK